MVQKDTKVDTEIASTVKHHYVSMYVKLAYSKNENTQLFKVN